MTAAFSGVTNLVQFCGVAVAMMWGVDSLVEWIVSWFRSSVEL